MPTARVLVPPTVSAEPVSLALVNAHGRLDLNEELVTAFDATGTKPEGADAALWGQVELANVFRRAARKKVEAHTGRYFAPQTLELTYSLSEPYQLPAGAVAVSVSGYFDTLEALAARATYLEEYRKGITVNREWLLAEGFAQTYAVVATVPGDVEYADVASRAILELTAEWCKNRETGGSQSQELPVSWRVTLAQAVVHPFG